MILKTMYAQNKKTGTNHSSLMIWGKYPLKNTSSKQRLERMLSVDFTAVLGFARK
jgi:hypothetical protein